MCGIAGIYNLSGKPISPHKLQRMIDIQRHRGPDDEGQYIDGSLGLGHCRLAIIDLSPTGHQPMSNEDGTIWIIYNGEIYNYLELRPELERKGHRFRSQSDTEVVIHAYEEYEYECLDRFNGMFAFVLWDRQRKRLFCARDRFGIKPLYYYQEGDTLYFASEIKAILAVAPRSREPNYPYLYRFLTFGAYQDGEDTFFQEIKSLPVAHYLWVDAGEIQQRRYWEFQPEKVVEGYDYSHPNQTFLELLTDSVRLRLRSDVPVGTCLSGGLDSSSIVGLTSRQISQPVRTFSAVYQEKECDESFFINTAAQHFKTEAFVTQPRSQDLFELLPRITWHMEGPTGGAGVYTQWHVMREARGRVKVLLDGQGGDELLGGYFHYFPAYLRTRLEEAWGKRDYVEFGSIWQECKEIAALTGEGIFLTALRSLYPRSLRAAYLRWRLGDFLHPEFEAQARRKGYDANSSLPRRFPDELSDRLYWSLVKESIPSLLHYEDRNSMAFSIEARVPFLDHRLAEFMLGLPYDLKIKGSTTKHILRQAMQDILPTEIVDRRDKKGYPTPAAKWFRESERQKVKEILFSSELKGRKIFDVNALEKKLERHCEGERDFSVEIWKCLTTELWFRQFIDSFNGQ